MDSLNILFGGQARTRMIRLFIFNTESVFDIDDVCERLNIKPKEAKKEFDVLLKAKLIVKKVFTKEIQKKIRGKVVGLNKKVHGFALNTDFPYTLALKELLMSSKNLEGGEILRRLSKSGKLKKIIITGVFIQNPESRVDILVVGDKLKKNILNNAIRSLEVELGKELNFAYFDTPDFIYRTSMSDKLIRDIMEFPHQVLLDKLSK
jgi:hypothetical protein